MARIARVVVPGVPHHVVQRGNRRLPTFLGDEDYAAYLELLGDQARRVGVAVWAYCLMPNHVHLIVVPATEDGLRAALSETHRRYTRRINQREGWQGHLWQERFASFPMDDAHLWAAARYVERNPVRAGLVKEPADWPWSSAKAHLAGADDGVVTVAPLLDMVDDWARYLAAGGEEAVEERLRVHGRTGRPLGDQTFVDKLEALTGRRLAKGKPGRRAKQV